MIASSLFTVGCSKGSSGSTIATTPTTILNGTNGTLLTPSGQIPVASQYSTVNSIDFVPVNFQEFSWYVATHPLNAPTNIKINIGLADNGNGRYGGDIRISYTDNGNYEEGLFHSGTSTNQSFPSYSNNDGQAEAEYNTWFLISGKKAFTGFFQDNYGAIVLVIDSSVNQGDGQGNSLVNGSVWYKNFAQSFATQGPMRKCWFITLGPYDCRAPSVINKTALTPDGGYRKLGTFSGLVKAAAFQ